MKKSFAEILAGIDSAREKKIAKKLPEWAEDTSLEYPSDLCLEQCSSSVTASYKAGLVLDAVGFRGRLTDITGGLGVDSLAFSRVMESVDYFERDSALAEAAGRNFKKLGAECIRVHNETVGTSTCLPDADIIYADPARRSSEGRKVFMLEDCTPDILTLLPALLDKAPLVLLKLSPMADTSMVHRKFGGHLRHVHIVSAGGEVKELLCLLDRDMSESYDITAADAVTRESFTFTPEEEEAAAVEYAGNIKAGQTLIEPGAAIMKSGAFKLLCSRWGLKKAAPSTHLYTHDGTVRIPLCKSFIIKDIFPFDKASLKTLRTAYPKAEVSARNIPVASEELRKKLGVAPGGNTHIFGCGTADRRNILIVCAQADS